MGLTRFERALRRRRWRTSEEREGKTGEPPKPHLHCGRSSRLLALTIPTGLDLRRHGLHCLSAEVMRPGHQR